MTEIIPREGRAEACFRKYDSVIGPFCRTMHLYTESESRVVVVIISQMLDKATETAQVSLEEFVEISGLSRVSVINATKTLMADGIVSRVKPGHRIPHIYRLEREGLEKVEAMRINRKKHRVH